LSVSAHGQPSRPTLLDEDFPPLLERSAVAASLGEACSIDNRIARNVQELVSLGASRQEDELWARFRALKSRHSENSNFLDVAKWCYLQGSKTKSLVSDAELDLASYAKKAARKLEEYESARRAWERERAEKASLVSALPEKTLNTVQRSGQRIINRAWRSSLMLGNLFGGIKYRSAEITDIDRAGNGYEVTARIHYLNVLDARQYLDVVFQYDGDGNGIGVTISGWSDVIAPESVSPRDLLGVAR
jgi:hypothetical protein